MENYTLKANESVLYKGDCRMINKNEKYLESLSTSTNAELVLTNLNLVIINKSKKLFAKEQVTVETYPIEAIKIYNDVPQIKQNDSRVEIFLTNEEKFIDFFSKSEARKLVNKVFELLTGKTMSTRVSDKVKGAVTFVDDTIGINTVGTIKNVVENGLVGSVLGGFGKNSRSQLKEGNQLTEVLSVTKDLFGKKTNEQENPKIETESISSIDSQIETLKKLKDLLDAGIISQDEFDAKKTQILNL